MTITSPMEEVVSEPCTTSEDSKESDHHSSGSFVKLIVGPEQEEFQVEESLLCAKCPYFLNALNGNFVEAKTRTFNFPDDDRQRIVDLCSWVKTDQLFQPGTQPSWIWLAKTWLFGEKYHIDTLQNDVMDALHVKYASQEEGVNISFGTLDFVAENTYQSSPLRRIFVDMLTNGISLHQLPERIENIPAELLQDMCIAMKTTIMRSGPTNVSLLTEPISTYYIDSSKSKSNAMPLQDDPSKAPTGIICQGYDCTRESEPQDIKNIMHICTTHNITLCDKCRHSHHGRRSHRKNMITFTTAPYQDFITGDSIVIDGHNNDNGFYCDGPKCDPEKSGQTDQRWWLLSGDRYHCLECNNIDYCTLCFRGQLDCKDKAHRFLRIRPTHAKKLDLTQNVTIKLKQERVANGTCWRCGDKDHTFEDCDAEVAVVSGDVEMED